GLRYNHPTAPEAYSSLRPAIVQLKTAQTPTDRFLSLSGIEYDPGDLEEIYHIFVDQLPERAIYDYVVATKEKEVLFFNLPLVYGLNAVDGYDGGLLPLKRFMDWQRLFLEEENLSTDGRLRERLRHVPSGRLLSLFGVRHIVTDKVHDVWLDNIFYDLQFPAYLNPDTTSEIWTTDIPPFAASAIGAVFHTPEKEGRVAQLVVRYTSGLEDRFDLRAGAGKSWENAEFGVDYNVVFDGLSSGSIEAIGLIAEDEVIVRGISLIQSANTTSRSVILSTEGNYRMIHGGDVKIYENLDVLPPTFIVHQTDIVPDVDSAIAKLRDPTFDVSTTMVRVAHDGETNEMISLGQADPEDRVTIIDYTPEQIELATNTKSAGWLVLMDTYYPGWQAWIDETQTEIMEVNIMFRAVELPAGKHKLVLVYRPQSFYRGALLSGVSLLIVALLLIIKPKEN
ncbi:MAG: YfhO family protein, partial [Aliifodinibius sp.]|nr:YfhO family protein [Fodinibius sp.]NIX01001.1 YfhO family protein [Phycisphaerae bacterium]NIY26429.1 YfhO family protein [Fodinibius sp.]